MYLISTVYATAPSGNRTMDVITTHGLRSNKKNLQQVARLIWKLEKLSAQLEAMLVESE